MWLAASFLLSDESKRVRIVWKYDVSLTCASLQERNMHIADIISSSKQPIAVC